MIYRLSLLAVLAVSAAILPGGGVSAGGNAIVVDSTADPGNGDCSPGSCTLREAIGQSIAGGRIEFEIPAEHCAKDGVCVILPTTPLPVIPRGVSIDAGTQDGFQFDPLVVIDGTLIDDGPGLTIEEEAVSIRALAVRRFQGAGIEISGDGAEVTESDVVTNGGSGIEINARNVTIDRTLVANNGGLGIDGSAGSTGLLIDRSVIEDNASTGIVVTGRDIEMRVNDILGNGAADGGGGVRTLGDEEANRGLVFFHNALIENVGETTRIVAADAEITENYINRNDAGGAPSAALRVSGSGVQVILNAVTNNTGFGVVISAGSGEGTFLANTILGSTDSGVIGSGEIDYVNNIVSVNGRDGFAIQNAGGSSFFLNVITTNEGNGIRIGGVEQVEPIIVGGPGNENVILNNGAAGVALDAGEVAGLGSSLIPPARVTISRNRIAENGGIGIDIFPDFVTENDDGDTDGGPNGTLNFPEIETADSTTVRGTSCARCLVEVFIADDSKATDHGEAAFFIGDGTADAAGEFAVALCGVTPGDELTATATDAEGNTSELSLNLVATEATSPCPEPTPTPTPAPSPSPTPTPDDKVARGDVQCDDDIDTVDALQGLRHVAALPVFQEDKCPQIGIARATLSQGLSLNSHSGDRFQSDSSAPIAPQGGAIFGDVDCDGDVDSVDALKVLRHIALLPVTQTEPCTDIGESS